MPKPRTNNAFSLVELSIVLVILGLLVGGILAGQSLIRASELRAVIAEHDRFKTAFHAFRDKYMALPGDMPNAVRFWGAQAGGTSDGVDATCIALTTAATGLHTCNGNGNGMIEDATGGHELFRFWQHLSNAGLIPGVYSGVAGSAGPAHAVLGVNDPASKITGAMWGMFSVRPGYLAQLSPSTGGHLLLFGANGATENDYPNNTIITATEAWNLDKKMDDGTPLGGNVRSMAYSYRPNCINAAETEYQISYNGLTCNLVFIIGN